jgi:hypothetical protein
MFITGLCLRLVTHGRFRALSFITETLTLLGSLAAYSYS